MLSVEILERSPQILRPRKRVGKPANPIALESSVVPTDVAVPVVNARAVHAKTTNVPVFLNVPEKHAALMDVAVCVERARSEQSVTRWEAVLKTATTPA